MNDIIFSICKKKKINITFYLAHHDDETLFFNGLLNFLSQNKKKINKISIVVFTDANEENKINRIRDIKLKNFKNIINLFDNIYYECLNFKNNIIINNCLKLLDLQEKVNSINDKLLKLKKEYEKISKNLKANCENEKLIYINKCKKLKKNYEKRNKRNWKKKKKDYEKRLQIFRFRLKENHESRKKMYKHDSTKLKKKYNEIKNKLTIKRDTLRNKLKTFKIVDYIKNINCVEYLNILNKIEEKMNSDIIFTHNKYGEYGHNQHKLVNYLVSILKKNKWKDKLIYTPSNVETNIKLSINKELKEKTIKMYNFKDTEDQKYVWFNQVIKNYPFWFNDFEYYQIFE